MKIIGQIVSVLIFLSGLIWFLQGIGVLPGSLMSGQSQWAVYGALAMLVGGGLYWLSVRKKKAN